MSEAPSKPVLTSKTIIANLIAMVAPYFATRFGFDLPTAEVTALLIAIVNIGLRFVTKGPVSLTLK